MHEAAKSMAVLHYTLKGHRLGPRTRMAEIPSAHLLLQGTRKDVHFLVDSKEDVLSEVAASKSACGYRVALESSSLRRLCHEQ